MVSFTRGSAVAARRRAGDGPPAPPKQAALLPAAYDELGSWSETPARDIVLLSRHAPVRVANELAQRHPECTVHLLDHHGISPERLAGLGDAVRLHPAPDTDARMVALAGLPAPQLIIDIASDLDGQLDRFAELFHFVAPGGAYVVHHRPRPAEAQPQSSDRPAPLVAFGVLAAGAHRALFDAERTAACSRVEFLDDEDTAGSLTVLGKRHEHRVSLRDAQADERLAARFATSWGETLAERPARRFEVTATIVEHGARGAWHGQTERPVVVSAMDVPRLRLRRYRDVVCWPQQVVAKDNLWLPDTFRHPSHDRLEHGKLAPANRWQARLKDPGAPPSRTVPGPLFYFDTEYPGHYGHVLTEVVSRWWGWREAHRLDPGVRPLVTRPAGSAGIPAFQRDVFSALGIDPDDVEYLDPGEAVSVGELYAASPMLSMPYYVSPELAETWATVGAALRSDDPGRATRLFVSRRIGADRSCLNTAEVEAFFRDLGFTLFYPEDHSFAEQVATFGAAEVVAGFAGSNMFTSMFAGPKRMIAITADSYNASNEFFITAVTGGELHYVIGDAQHKHPRGGWTWLAYKSNYTVDLQRFGPEIHAVLDAWEAKPPER